jgi:hypothetical protein
MTLLSATAAWTAVDLVWKILFPVERNGDL